MESMSAGEPGALQVETSPALVRALRTETHLRIGQMLLTDLRLNRHSPVEVVCFITTELGAGLTFHVRLSKGRARAGMVTVTCDALDAQGVAAMDEALAYLLDLAFLRRLPRVQATDRTPLVGLWRAENVWKSAPDIESSRP